MKIVVFIHSLSGGGAERVAINLSRYWVERGHTVTILTLAGAEEDFYLPDCRVKRIALGLARDSQNAALGLWANMNRIKALRTILYQERPDVVLSLMTTANVLAILAARNLPIAVVASERIHPPQFPLGRTWECLRRWSYGWSDAIVALTSESADWLRQHTNARRVVVIPNPVLWPLPSQPPILEPHSVLPNQRKVVLGVGRLAFQKGFDILIKAFSRIARNHLDWDLVILGEGPERSALENLTSTLCLNERVYLPGLVGNISDWYKAADIYIMSSRFEGFPNTLAEALASGCPAVSFDCDTGPRDIIRHEIDGLLVSPGDVEALSSAMTRLMDNEALRSEFAVRAVEARERFSIERIGAMWEELFNKVMGEIVSPTQREIDL